MIGVASGETALIVRITEKKKDGDMIKNHSDTCITCFRAFPVPKTCC